MNAHILAGICSPSRANLSANGTCDVFWQRNGNFSSTDVCTENDGKVVCGDNIDEFWMQPSGEIPGDGGGYGRPSLTFAHALEIRQFAGHVR